MSQTPNLGLPHIHANQGQKEVTANQFADGLDIAIAGCITINLTGKAEYALSSAEARNAILTFKGQLTAPVTVMIPTENANKKFIVSHQCTGDFPLQFKHPNTDAVNLQPDKNSWIFSDGQQLLNL